MKTIVASDKPEMYLEGHEEEVIQVHVFPTE